MRYVATTDMTIQGHRIEAGQTIATGDLSARLIAAHGLEHVVGVGHVRARLADGRVAEQPDDEIENIRPKAKRRASKENRK